MSIQGGNKGGGQDQEFVEPVRILWRRKWTIIAVVLVGSLLAGIITPLLPKTYSAKSILIFPTPSDSGGGLLGAVGALSGQLGGALGMPGGPGISQDTVTVILGSKTVQSRIVRKYDLKRHYASSDEQAAMAKLGGRSTIRHTRQGSVEIAVDDSDRKMAADIANSYVSILKEFVAENVNLFLSRQKAKYLEGALADCEAALDTAERDFARYASDHDIISLDAEAEALVKEFSDVETQRRLAEAEQQYATTLLTATKSALKKIATSPPESLPAHSPLLQSLRTDLVELNYDLAMARKDRTDIDPRVKALQASIDETMKQARQELGRIAMSADQGTAPEVLDLVAVSLGQQAKTEALTKARDEMVGVMRGIPQTALEYSRLKREVDVQQKIYATLRSEYEAAKVGQAVEEEPFVVLDRAEPPIMHSQPRLRVNLAIAFVLSAVIGILAALVAEGKEHQAEHADLTPQDAGMVRDGAEGIAIPPSPIDVIMFGLGNWHDWEGIGFPSRNARCVLRLLSDDRFRNVVLFNTPTTILKAISSAGKAGMRRRLGLLSSRPRTNLESFNPVYPLRLTKRVGPFRRLNVAFASRWCTIQSRLAIDRLKSATRIVWVANPVLAPAASEIRGANLLVFDAIDDWRSRPEVAEMRPEVERGYRVVREQFDLITTVSERLAQIFEGSRGEVQCVHNGYDAEQFRLSPPDAGEPDDLAAIPHPRIGYVGMIQNRIDTELCRAIAQIRSEWQLVFVGRKLSPEHLREIEDLPNVHILGERPHGEIARYVHGFDVCMIPHRLGDFTASMDPLKLYEYLACGRPVVSTPVPPMSDYGDAVFVAADAHEFVEAVQNALASDRPEDRERRAAAVQDRRWDAVLDGMLNTVLSRTSRKSVA